MSLAFSQMYLTTNASYLQEQAFPILKELLENINESQELQIQSTHLTNPQTVLIISLLFGYLGFDRILIGEYFLGILKLITFGGFGFWYVTDWFVIMRKTRYKNTLKVMKIAFPD